VRAGRHFVVYDAKTGEDLTRSILTQIILEEDSKGRNLLPINFLRQLIGYYDDNLRAFLPRYLELSMENFAANQEQIRRYIEGTFGQFFPMNQFEDMARQNMALFHRAATMFAPLNSSGNAADEGAGEDNAGSDGTPPAMARADTSAEIKALSAKIEDLQKQICALVETRTLKD
jgi:polyhydroxyalkanoate synthesis repressor PhaR